MSAEIRKMDKRGRIVIPKKWREEHKEDEFLMELGDKEIKLIPLKATDLTKYFDSIEVDLESDLSDRHSVRSELGEI